MRFAPTYYLPIFITGIILLQSCQAPKKALDPTYSGYRSRLEQMEKNSMQVRRDFFRAMSEFGRQSQQAEAAERRMLVEDSLMMADFVQLEAQFGWPDFSKVGKLASHGAFLVIQHSHQSQLERYYPKMLRAAQNKEAHWEYVALMKDRMLTWQGEKQLFGTQRSAKTNRDGSRTTYILPIKEQSTVNKRRRKYKMPRIKLSKFTIRNDTLFQKK